MGVKASDVVNLAKSCIGIDKRKVIDTYNAHKPLAIGHVMQYYEPWCDTFLSYLFIVLNAVDLIGGTECGVERHIQLFKAKGIWEEDGNIIPRPGDIICYNWDDNTQPNDGFADHIGLVKSVDGNKITLIEGNLNDQVAERIINVGYGCIRGYAQPKYDSATTTVTPTQKTATRNMNGIDIASYQAGINTQGIEADFIIVKATQGASYVNPDFIRQIDGAIKGGKIVGLYHYATGIGVTAEVDHFLRNVNSYIGKAFLCLDWETSTAAAGMNTQFRNPGYAKQFMDVVKERTGLTMFIYGSKDSCFNAMDWTAVAKAGYPLWGAQYKDNKTTVYGYQSNPWQSSSPWGAWGNNIAIHQYTSLLRLPGYSGDLDGNICYLTADQLKEYAKPKNNAVSISGRTYEWLEEKRNGEWIGSRGESKQLNPFQINPPDGVELEVTVHIQSYGDKTYKGITHDNNIIIGAVEQIKRIEAITIKCVKNTTGKRIKYQGHVQTYGDTKICSEGEFCGTRGESKRLEAIRIWFE